MSPTLRIIRQVHWKREEPSREIVRFCGRILPRGSAL